MPEKIETEVTVLADERIRSPVFSDHPLSAENMFKISKGYDHVTKTIRIPEPMAEKLEQLAAENRISLNRLVNQCILFALEHRDRLDNDELAEIHHT